MKIPGVNDGEITLPFEGDLYRCCVADERERREVQMNPWVSNPGGADFYLCNVPLPEPTSFTHLRKLVLLVR